MYRLQREHRLYLVYSVIGLCAGPKLRVFVYDLQRSDHQVLGLFSAARKLPQHRVEEREAERKSWSREWRHIYGKNKTRKKRRRSRSVIISLYEAHFSSTGEL